MRSRRSGNWEANGMRETQRGARGREKRDYVNERLVSRMSNEQTERRVGLVLV